MANEERTLLLKCVFVGKAQVTFASLSKSDCVEYEKVTAVLRAYKLVPKTYRKRFRNIRQQDTQTHVEFVHSLETEFNRWCTSAGVNTSEGRQFTYSGTA